MITNIKKYIVWDLGHFFLSFGCVSMMETAERKTNRISSKSPPLLIHFVQKLLLVVNFCMIKKNIFRFFMILCQNKSYPSQEFSYQIFRCEFSSGEDIDVGSKNLRHITTILRQEYDVLLCASISRNSEIINFHVKTRNN